MSRFHPPTPKNQKIDPETKTNLCGTVRVLFVLVSDSGVGERGGIVKGNIAKTIHVGDVTVTELHDYVRAQLFNR